MLSVLSFKQSMFAGVLDGGTPEVALGGTRLKRFMDSVDQVTGNIPTAMPRHEEPAQIADAGEPNGSPDVQSEQPQWEDLLSAGLSFLDKLGSALSTEQTTPVELGPGLRIETDKASGQRHLTLPVPPKKVLSDLAGLLARLAEKL
jgi:hypothetical protein